MNQGTVPSDPIPSGGETEGRLTRDAAHLARGGVLQILAAVGQAALPVYQIVVARLFGPVIYGTYQAAASMIEVLVRASVCGSDKAMLRFVAVHHGRADRPAEAADVAAGFRLTGLVGGVMAGLVVLFAGSLERFQGAHQLAITIRWMAPAIVATPLMLVAVAATLGAQASRIHLLVRGVVEPGALLLGAVVAWRLGGGLRNLAVAHAAAACLTLVVALWGAGQVFGRGFAAEVARARPRKGLPQFAVPLGLADITNAILQRADILILTAFVPLSSVALYAAAEQIARGAGAIRLAFDGLAAPMLSDAWHAGDRARLRGNLKMVTRWVALGAAPIAAGLLALRQDVLRLFGPTYVAASVALTFLILSALVNGVVGITPYVLVMSGRSRLFFWTNLGAAALNVGLNLFLIPRLGIVGAAIAAMTSVVGLQAALATEVWILEGVHAFDFRLARPFVAAVIVFGLGRGLTFLAMSPAARGATTVAIGLPAYIGSLWLTSGQDERRFIRQLISRVSSRRG